jgi:hypothetical protein
MSGSSQTTSANPFGKSRQPEEEKKGGLDARDLIGRFRSKTDIYEYLGQHRKHISLIHISIAGNYYLPPKKKVTKDFLKEIFAGRKHLVPCSQIHPINVPHYDELSVVTLIKDVMGQPSLAKFFPEQKTHADLPDREFFFNIINTTEPEYLAALIKHAHDVRLRGRNPQDNPNTIEVTDEWVKELKASPFYSSKMIRVVIV